MKVAAVAPVPGRMPSPMPMSEERMSVSTCPAQCLSLGKMIRRQSMGVGVESEWTS